MAVALIRNSFTHIGEVDASVLPSTLTLKLCVQKDAVRYFVVSQTHGKVLFHGDYTLHHVQTNTELAERLERIFEKDEVLQLPFGEVRIAVNANYTVTPPHLSAMLLQKEQLAQHCGKIDLVFHVPLEIQNTALKVFRHSVLYHVNGPLYTGLLGEAIKSSAQIFVNVAKEHLDIVRFNPSGELLMMNRYNYKAASDFIYFLLLCCDEFNINREETTLVLIGEISSESAIYSMCDRYFQTIRFIEPPETVCFTNAFADYPKHVHYNLYNL